MKTLKTILLPVGIGLGLLGLLGVLGSTLFLFREASAVHPALGWTVVALLLTALYFLLLAPTLRILALPKVLRRPAENTGPDWTRYVERYADRLLGNARLADWPGLGDVRAARAMGDLPALELAVAKAVTQLDKIATQAISTHAAAVFVATGASQSGRLDIGIVLSTQVRMIKEVAEIYYQRPRPRELWSLYSNVGGSAFLAGEIQDSELIAVLGAPVSAALSGFVPVSGTAPLISLLVHSLLDGSANALLTLRVGVLARKHCGLRLDEPKNLLARSASLEAAALLGGVVATGANRIATATRRLVVRSTVHAPQTAARGAAQAGTAMVEGLAKAANRAGTKAWTLSRDAFRQVGQLGTRPESPGALDTEAPRRGGEVGSRSGTERTPDRSPRSAPGSASAGSAATDAVPAPDPVLREAVTFWERVAEMFAP